MNEFVIKAENLSKRYHLRPNTSPGWRKNQRLLSDDLINLPKRLVKRVAQAKPIEFWALKDASFETYPGEILGIIGRNGAGKSTLLKLLSQVTEPTYGSAIVNGRVGSLLEVGTGFHSELTGRENIFISGAIIGMSRAEIKSKFDEIVDFSGVNDFLDTPVKRFSSGMEVRLAFSVAVHLRPQVLLVDEVLSIGDAEFQAKSLQKIKQVAIDGGTVLFISHNLGSIAELCNSAMVLDHGTIVYPVGEVKNAIGYYHSILENSQVHSLNQVQESSSTIRITDFHIEDSQNLPADTLTSGFPVNFVIDISSEIQETLGDVYCIISFFTQKGDLIASIRSQEALGKLIPSSHHGTIRCFLEQFPLAPGLIRITLSLEKNGQIINIVENAYAGPIESLSRSDKMGKATDLGWIMLKSTWSSEQ
jgi:ABC-type polysaccharide/polyol phosphate transport system, ATPase component